MNFSKPFTDKEKIQLLQRSILVNAYAYYELNKNILSDYQYDMNALQLEALKASNPDAYKKSRYYKYFADFESGTGFDLVSKIQANKTMRKKIERDASWALKLKEERSSYAD